MAESAEYWLGWEDATSSGPGWVHNGLGPNRNNQGSALNGNRWAALSVEYDLLADGDQVVYRVRFEPLSGEAAQVAEFAGEHPDGSYLIEFILMDSPDEGASMIAGVYTITATINGVATKNTSYLTITGNGSEAGYAAMSWYSETNEEDGGELTDALMGWGTPYFAGGEPAGDPVSQDSAGTASYMPGSNWMFGAATLGGHTGAVQFLMTCTPVDGSPVLTRTFTDNPVLADIFFHSGESWFDPVIYGVYEITGTVGGVPFANQLVCTLTAPEWGGYGTVVYYAEGMAPPVSEFWTDFLQTREVP